MHGAAIKIIMIPFCNKRTTHKILILRKKQAGGTLLRMANALRGRISPTYLDYS
jgi:hypothetical protein